MENHISSNPSTRPKRNHSPFLARIGLAVAAALPLAGCATAPKFDYFRRQADHSEPLDLQNARPVSEGKESWLATVHSGDLIFGAGFSPMDLLGCLSHRTFSEYSHMGIIVWENHEPFVYEALGGFRLFKETDHLLGKIEGTIERNPLESFIQRYDRSQIIRLPNPEKNAALAEAAKKSFGEHLAFDPYFDLSTPAVYCAEYVRYVMRKVDYGLEPLETERTDNPGLSTILTSLRITDQHFLVTQSFRDLLGTEEIADIDRFASAEKSTLAVEGWRVLHDHFTAQSKIGDYLQYDDDTFLRFSPEVTLYFGMIGAYFEAQPTDDLQEVRRVLGITYDAIFEPEESATR